MAQVWRIALILALAVAGGFWTTFCFVALFNVVAGLLAPLGLHPLELWALTPWRLAATALMSLLVLFAAGGILADRPREDGERSHKGTGSVVPLPDRSAMRPFRRRLVGFPEDVLPS